MKKFTFTLEILKNTKEIQEKEIRKEMAGIENRLAEQRKALDNLDKEVTNLVSTWQKQMAKGLKPVSLQHFNSNFLQLREQQIAIQASIRKTEQEKIACQELLTGLLTDLKGLEKLREQQFEQYRQDQARELETEIGEFVNNHRQQVMTI